jgi:signal transduction histidine kinase/ActR/RegA family two-component response regulator
MQAHPATMRRLLVLLLTAMAALLSPLFTREEAQAQSTCPTVPLVDNWESRATDGSWHPIAKPFERSATPTERWYRVRLPQFSCAEAEIYAYYVEDELEVLFENQLVYSFHHAQNAWGYPYHLFKIPPEASAGYLTFHITSRLGNIGFSEPLRFGDHDAFDRFLVQKYLPVAFLGILYLVLGLLVLSLSLFLRFHHAYRAYGFLLLVLGSYSFSLSRLRQLISPNYTLFCWIEYISVFLLPVAILLFINAMFPFRRKRLYKIVMAAIAISSLGLLTWSFTNGIIVLIKSFPAIQAMGFLLTIITIGKVTEAAYRKEPMARITLVSFLVFSATFFIDLLSSLDLLPVKLTLNMYGNLALIAAFGYMLVRQFLIERESITSARITADQLLELETILAIVPGFVLCLDRQLNYVRVNDRLAQYFGLPRKDFIGKPVGTFAYNFTFRRQLEEFMQSSKMHDSIQVSFPLKPDEPPTDLLVSGQKNPSGNSVVLTLLDISDLKRAEAALRENEEQYRNLFEEMISGVALFSIENAVDVTPQGLKLVRANEAFRQHFPKHTLHLVGKSLAELFPSLAPGEFVRFCAALKGNSSVHFEIPLPDLDGVFEIRAYVPFPNHLTIVFNDVTARVASEAEKGRIQSQLLHSEKLASIGTLAAGVAHEINNPLAIALGNLELATARIVNLTPQDEQLIRQMTRQQQALERIAGIVSGLRTYSRADTNKVEPVDIHKAVLDTLSLCETIFAKEGIAIEKRLEADPTIINGNMGKLQQVIMNCLTNARDAFKEHKLDRSARIAFQTSCTGSEITLAISDNGPGIPKEVMGRIFDPFFTTKAPGKGTGLGLSISHTIVTELGGTLRCESSIGTGATFFLTFPAASNTQTITEKSPGKRESFELRALVVDDEPDICELVRMQLTRLGLTVTTVTNGEEALQALTNSAYDCIFSDLRMPHMGGYELLREIRNRKISTPFVVLTGGIATDFPLEWREFLTKEAQGYLKKPLASLDLTALLDRLFPESRNG